MKNAMKDTRVKDANQPATTPKGMVKVPFNMTGAQRVEKKSEIKRKDDPPHTAASRMGLKTSGTRVTRG